MATTRCGGTIAFRGLRRIRGRVLFFTQRRTVLIFERPPQPDNKNRMRVNRMIRISPVRVIAPDGEQMGILTVDEAIAAAEARGLDLVEVAPMARPPVCRIMDFGKFKFEQAKAARAAKKKQKNIELKEDTVNVKRNAARTQAKYD